MLAGDACAEPRAAAFALLEQTSAVAATSADVGTGTSVKQNFDGIVAFPALPRSSIVCEPQAALVRTWLVDPRYRVAGVDVLRAAAALGPADVQPPPLMLATENPQAAWAAVVACADDQFTRENAASSLASSGEGANASEVGAGAESGSPLLPPCTENALREACRVKGIALRCGYFALIERWAERTPLVTEDRLVPLVRRVLAAERVAEVHAAAELAASAAFATPHCATMAVGTDKGPNSDVDDNLALASAPDPAAVVRAAAVTAAREVLPYFRRVTSVGAGVDGDALSAAKTADTCDLDPSSQMAPLATAAGPRPRRRRYLNDPPTNRSIDRSPGALTSGRAGQLLWLAEMEKLRGLATLATLCAGPGHGNNSDNTDDKTIDGIRALGCVGAFDTDVCSAVSQGYLNGDDGGVGAEPSTQVLEKRAVAGTAIDARTGAVATLAAEVARDAVAATESAARCSGDQVLSIDNTGITPSASAAARFSTAVRYLARAGTRAREARAWHLAVCACKHIWNATASLWISPLAFAPRALAIARFEDQPQLDPAPFVEASYVLLDVLARAPHASAASNWLRPPSVIRSTASGNDKDHVRAEATEATLVGEVSTRDVELTYAHNGSDTFPSEALADVGLDPEWVCQFVAYTLRCLAYARRWDVLPPLARRLVASKAAKVCAIADDGGLAPVWTYNFFVTPASSHG
jgi:hypothetical protein